MELLILFCKVLNDDHGISLDVMYRALAEAQRQRTVANRHGIKDMIRAAMRHGAQQAFGTED